MKINLIIEHSNLIELLISYYNLLLFTKMFCRFSGILIEKTTFEEFVETANKFTENKKFNLMM